MADVARRETLRVLGLAPSAADADVRAAFLALDVKWCAFFGYA
jgi:hypothetical protein